MEVDESLCLLNDRLKDECPAPNNIPTPPPKDCLSYQFNNQSLSPCAIIE